MNEGIILGVKRLFTIIAAVGFALIPFPGKAAMEKMTNDSLKKVESDSRLSSLPDAYSEKNLAGAPSHRSEFSRFESEITTLRQSQSYVKLFLLLNKLEKISKKRNYEEIVASAYFLALCSNIADFSRNCRNNLSALEATIEDYQMKELLKAHCKLFMRITYFYQCVFDHQNGKGKLPDLKELVDEIRFRQDFFETEYNKIKSLNY